MRHSKPSGRGRGRLALALTAVLALAFLLIPAAQAFANGALTVSITGAGSGEVSSVGGWEGSGFYEGSPPIECSYASPGPAAGTCETELVVEPEGFPGYELIALKGTANPGSLLKGMKVTEGLDAFEECETNPFGNCLAGQPEGGGNAAVTATFVPAKKLKVLKEGSGTVVSNPAGINCGATCEVEFEENTLVTLTASPAVGYAFKSWKKCDAEPAPGVKGVNGRQCTVKMSAAKEVTAVFAPVKNLKVNVAGSGSVKSKPGGILCLPGCSSQTAAFAEGSEVELLQAPSKNWTFAGWSGACSGTGACKPTMSADQEVTATFTEVPKRTLTLTKSGGGTALIKTKPTGINCGFTCSANASSFYEGTEVEVAWKLNKGTTSIEWSPGAAPTCTGISSAPEGTCKVTMSAAKSLGANLK